MGLKVVWLRLAEEKLEDIYNYYSEKAGITTARKIVLGIVDTTIDLEHNPEIGQTEELLVHKGREFRYLIYKNYKVVYRLHKERNIIEIANVFDTRQNPYKLVQSTK